MTKNMTPIEDLYDPEAPITWAYDSETGRVSLTMHFADESGERRPTVVGLADGKKRETRLDVTPCNGRETDPEHFSGLLLGMSALAGHALGGVYCQLSLDGAAIKLPDGPEDSELPVTLRWAPGVTLDALRDAVLAVALGMGVKSECERVEDLISRADRLGTESAE